MKHVVRCPHCRASLDLGEARHREMAKCPECDGKFHHLGLMPTPDRNVKPSPEVPWVEASGMDELPEWACSYCGCGVGEETYCERCGSDYNLCAVFSLHQRVADLDGPDVRAFDIQARAKISPWIALVRLHRLHRDIAAQFTDLPDVLSQCRAFPMPNLSKDYERRERLRLQAEAENDDTWRGEAYQSSLRWQVAKALTMVFGFYSTALGIGLLLVLLGLWFIFNGFGLNVITIGMMIFGGSIIATLKPQRNEFIAPGPRLTPQDQPELFAVIEEVAAGTQQPVPDEVYAVGSVNAFVTHRGGVLGIGSKRVMGIGLPLLQSLTISQFKGVIAHEFGHFHGGDLRLGPVIYRAREAIAQIMKGFVDNEESSLHKRLSRFLGRFLNVSMQISRRQEYNADAVAAQLVGANHLIEGLRRTSGAYDAFDRYWQSSCAHLLETGFVPQLTLGFKMYLEREETRQALAQAYELAGHDRDWHPFSTHPPTAYRIKNIQRFEDKPVVPNEAAAFSLLREEDKLNVVVFDRLLLSYGAGGYPVLDWDQVGERLWVPMWQNNLHQVLDSFSETSLADAPQTLADPDQAMAGIMKDDPNQTDDDRYDNLKWLFSAALALALKARGWRVGVKPGDDPVLTRNERECIPTHMIDQLAAGDLSGQDWQAWLEQEALTTFTLGDLAGEVDFGATKQERRPMSIQNNVPPLTALPLPKPARLMIAASLIPLAAMVAHAFIESWAVAQICLILCALMAATPLIWRFVTRKQGVGTMSTDASGFSLKTKQCLLSAGYADLEKLKIYRTTYKDQEGWPQVRAELHLKAKGQTMVMSGYHRHPGAQALFHTMIHHLVEERAEAVESQLDAGSSYCGPGWTLTPRGLETKHGLYEWSRLQTPARGIHTFLFAVDGNIKPILTVPRDSDHAGVLYHICTKRARFEYPPDHLGEQILDIYATPKRSRNLYAALAAMTLMLVCGFASVGNGLGVILAAPAALLVIPLWWYALNQHLSIYDHGLVVTRPIGARVFPYAELTAMWLKIKAEGHAVMLHIKLKGIKKCKLTIDYIEHKSFCDALIQATETALVDRYMNELLKAGSLTWFNGGRLTPEGVWVEPMIGKEYLIDWDELVIGEDHIQSNRNPSRQTSIPLDAKNARVIKRIAEYVQQNRDSLITKAEVTTE